MNTFKSLMKIAVKPTTIVFTVVSLLGAPVFSACKYGGHLKVAIPGHFTSMDPHLGRSGWDAYLWRQFTDHLVDADRGLNPRPMSSLAEKWEVSSNPDALTLTLRKGIEFHDGTPFNAEAVKANIERILDPANSATPRSSLAIIQSVDVLSENKVRLNLSGPWGAGLSQLADRGGAMNSPTAISKLGEDYGAKAVGTGPFVIKEAVQGSHVHFVRNENYWGKDKDGNRLPYLDEITIRQVKKSSVRTAALRSGEIDLAYASLGDIEAFEADAKFNTSRMEAGKINLMLMFNTKMLDDPNLRNAITHAIDPAFINKAIYFGQNTVADSGMWLPGAWAHDPSVPRPSYNPAKAKDFLKKAGKPDGFEFTMVTFGARKPESEVMQAQLAQVGIKMNIEVMSGKAAGAAFFKEGKFAMYATSFSRYPEPDWAGSNVYKSGGYYNAANLPNPELDALIEKGAALSDIDERKKIYRKVDEIVLGQSIVVPMVYQTFVTVASKKVGNIDTVSMHDGKMNFREVCMTE